MKRVEHQASTDDAGQGADDKGKASVEPIAVVVVEKVEDDSQRDSAVDDDDKQSEHPGSEFEHREPSDPLPTEDAPFGYKADGTPRKSNQGRRSAPAQDEFAKQRAKLRSVTASTPRVKKTPPISSPAMAVVNYQAMGEQVAQLWFSGGIMVFGADWAPDVPSGEPQSVAGAFASYFKATNMRDLPPGFALCFVLGTYTMTRLVKPQSSVATRFQRIGLWFKEKAGSFKRRKSGIVYDGSESR